MFGRKKPSLNFSQGPTLLPIQSKTNFPSGLVVSTETGQYYMGVSTKKKFFSTSCFNSWSLNPILASDEAIKHIPLTGKLGFREGSLIHNLADGKIYLISSNKRRQVIDPKAFDAYGISPNTAIMCSDQEANMHELGEPLG